MDSYLVMVYVTLQQETAVKQFFEGKGWKYVKPDLLATTSEIGAHTQRNGPVTIVAEDDDPDSLNSDNDLPDAQQQTHPAPKQTGRKKTRKRKQRLTIGRVRKTAKLSHGGSDKERGGSDQERDGSDMERGGSDQERGGSDQERDSSDQERDGLDKERGGSDKERDGSDKERDGSVKERVETEHPATDNECDNDDVNDESEIDGGDVELEREEEMSDGDDDDCDNGSQESGVERTDKVIVKTEVMDDSFEREVEHDEESRSTRTDRTEARKRKVTLDGEMVADVDTIKLDGTEALSLVELMDSCELVNNHTYTCSKCGLTIKRRYNLKRHLLTHLPKHCQIRCMICNKYFKSNQEKDEHQKSKHSSVLVCHICGATFSRPANLNTHLSKHDPDSGVALLSCPVENCLKTFSRKSSLMYHLNVHNGERPFECEYCGHRYHSKYTRNMHRKVCPQYTYNKDAVVGCRYCNELFESKSELNEHEKVEHAQEKVAETEAESTDTCADFGNQNNPFSETVKTKLDKSISNDSERVTNELGNSEVTETDFAHDKDLPVGKETVAGLSEVSTSSTEIEQPVKISRSNVNDGENKTVIVQHLPALSNQSIIVCRKSIGEGLEKTTFFKIISAPKINTSKPVIANTAKPKMDDTDSKRQELDVATYKVQDLDSDHSLVNSGTGEGVVDEHGTLEDGTLSENNQSNQAYDEHTNHGQIFSSCNIFTSDIVNHTLNSGQVLTASSVSGQVFNESIGPIHILAGEETEDVNTEVTEVVDEVVIHGDNPHDTLIGENNITPNIVVESVLGDFSKETVDVASFLTTDNFVALSSADNFVALSSVLLSSSGSDGPSIVQCDNQEEG